MKKITFAFFFLLSSAAMYAQSNDAEPIAITVYNNDLGVVRDVRKFDISSGTTEVRMKDVPAKIDPTSVKITDRAHPNDLDVLEQNYEYDLVSEEKLLEKYVDNEIVLTNASGKKITGTLLSAEGGKPMIQTDSGILMLQNLNGYSLSAPKLPGGLITKPTLVWEMQSSRNLSQEPLEVMYQTSGMSWHAEYIAALSDDDKSLDLSGWVSVENKSGTTFENAKLKLVAGSINRVAQAGPSMADMTYFGGAKAKPQFEEHGMFEYHVYDLGRTTTLENDEVKQISLLTANQVGAEKRYTYEGGKNVAVTVSFENSKESNLGIPLPAGVIRVMKLDIDGSLEFVGEDRIEHTPRDEKITLHVGNAFDLVGDRQVTSSRTLGERESEETVEITLKNHKDEDVTIDAVENLGTDWHITDHSMEYEKRNANSIVFHIPVKANGEQTVTYTVQHLW